jgi:hypothetical protein
MEVKTSHWGGCMNYCPECSWKATWGDNPGCIMFGSWHRPFDCVEPEPTPVNVKNIKINRALTLGSIYMKGRVIALGFEPKGAFVLLQHKKHTRWIFTHKA